MLNVFLFSDYKLYIFNEKCSVAELTFKKKKKSTLSDVLFSSALSDDVFSMVNMSGSDSEASHSNVRTTISMAPRPVQPTVNNLEFEQLVSPGMEAKTITQNANVRVSKENVASVGGTTPMHNQVTEGRKDIQLGKSHSANEMHSASHCSCHK